MGVIEAGAAVPEESNGDQRLAILLAMAMFVLVVDTSLMNVSISAVVQDLAGQPPDVQDEIIRINTEARPIALQIALLIPLLAGLLGLLNGVRMTRLPDPEPSTAAEAVLGG